MDGVLDYAPGTTIVHRLNPLVKIAFAFCVCVAAFLTESLPVLACLLAVGIAVGCAGGIPRRPDWVTPCATTPLSAQNGVTHRLFNSTW